MEELELNVRVKIEFQTLMFMAAKVTCASWCLHVCTYATVYSPNHASRVVFLLIQKWRVAITKPHKAVEGIMEESKMVPQVYLCKQ